MGCLLALCERGVSQHIIALAARFIAVPVMAIGAHMALLSTSTPAGQGVGNIMIAIWSCWLIAALPHAPTLRAILSAAPLSFIGRISYGIYLWHHPIFEVGDELLIAHWRWIAIGVSVAVATMSYYGFEVRFLKLRDRIRPKGAPADVPAASTT